jgi:hypothetical protein
MEDYRFHPTYLQKRREQKALAILKALMLIGWLIMASSVFVGIWGTIGIALKVWLTGLFFGLLMLFITKQLEKKFKNSPNG